MWIRHRFTKLFWSLCPTPLAVYRFLFVLYARCSVTFENIWHWCATCRILHENNEMPIRRENLQTQTSLPFSSTTEFPVSYVMMYMYLTPVLYLPRRVAATSPEQRPGRANVDDVPGFPRGGDCLVRSSLQPRWNLMDASLRKPRTGIAVVVPGMSWQALISLDKAIIRKPLNSKTTVCSPRITRRPLSYY